MNGEVIRALRLREGMTQEDFARKLGVSANTISAVEVGTRAVSDRIRVGCVRLFGEEAVRDAARLARFELAT